MKPTGSTRVAAVIGDPIDHSLSPTLFNAAFAECGIDWVFVAFRVAAGQGRGAVEAMRTLELAGLSVTMPHKSAAAAAVDTLTPAAAVLESVNNISWSSRGAQPVLVGDSTDGAGFLDALRLDEGFDPAGRSCLVVGAGGAARAVVRALAEAGAASVAVVARNQAMAGRAAGLAGEKGRPVEPGTLPDEVGAAELLVNATPVGMAAGDGLPMGIDAAWLRPGQFVADLIYHPAVTPLISAARTAGAFTGNGLGMLIHQAARQFETWTGRPAPLEAMSAAALGALGRSRGGDPAG